MAVRQRTVDVGKTPLERTIVTKNNNAQDDKSHVNTADDIATDDLHLNKFKQHFQRK